MKLGNLKPVRRPSKFRRWLSNASALLASRYVKDCHPAFMTYVEKNNLMTASIWQDASAKRFRQIMKILNSDKYKKFFYKAISYDPSKKEHSVIERKWYVVAFDKVVYHLSKAYVFVFEKELYKKIKYFEKVSAGVADLSARVDKYIASTTFEQRLLRMREIGIISRQTFEDDFDVIMKRVPPEVIEERYQKAPEQSFGSQWNMRRKMPDNIVKLIRGE
jgi:hypothetical protein